MRMRSGTRVLVALICLTGMASAANANPATHQIRERMPNGYTALAEYREGRPDKVPAIVVHGFLGTNYYPTMEIIKDTLNAQGHAVVAPMLTLNINNRKGTLSCEAVHTHDMQQGIREVRYWIDWTRRKTGKMPIVAGHSFGAVMALASLTEAGGDFTSVPKFIGVALVATEYYAKRGATNEARKKLQLGPLTDELGKYPLSYCQTYIAPPRAFLSYAAWDYDKISAAIMKISKTLPMYGIVGSSDDRLPPKWADKMRENGVTVTVIDGANHFFGGEHEFTLMETLERLLQ